ncbi:MAG: hypothetical protein JXR48_09675 [Candidatus Delongbacteria bacterium]|nr:hypothetical protein [Candidatus Delongbacteria bacterium]MBN2835222.1 hypothetical protein [Candidatus Delongbacteria bacterium]
MTRNRSVGNMNRYSILAGLGVLATMPLNGAVVYTDIGDIVLESDQVTYIDLDNDEEWDFGFFHGSSSSSAGFYMREISFGKKVLFSGFFCVKLGEDYVLNNETPFDNLGMKFLWDAQDPQSWKNGEDGYIGVSFEIEEGIHYGWIRVSSSPTSTTIKDFAYNDTPGASIKTGEKAPSDLTPPTIELNTGVSLWEGDDVTITNLMLKTTDETAASSAVTYTLTTEPSWGELRKNNVKINLNGTFTQDDIDNSLIKYVNGGTEHDTDSFGFKVSDGVNEITDQTFSITVQLSNDPPTIATNTGMTLNEGESKFLTTTVLSAADEETPAAELTITVTTNPENGTLEHVDNPSSPISTFTQADLVSGSKIKYIHDGSNTTSDSFIFKVTDKSIHGDSPFDLQNITFDITINAIDDDPPVVSINTGTTLDQGTTKYLTNTMLAASDTEFVGSVTYKVTAVPTHGTLKRGITVLVQNDTFVQEDINEGEISYINDDSNNATDSFKFTVQDNIPNFTEEQTFSFSINLRNQIPVYTEVISGGQDEFSVNEDNQIEITFNQLLSKGNASDSDDGDSITKFIVKSVANGTTLKIGSTSELAILWDSETNNTIDETNNAYWSIDTENANGQQISAFDLVAVDSHNAESTPALTLKVNVEAINDPPENDTKPSITPEQTIRIGGKITGSVGTWNDTADSQP